MTVKDFMKNYRAVTEMTHPFSQVYGDGIMSIMRPRIVCNDGFSVSVQGSVNHYCSPRLNLLYESYEEVELGYPSVADKLIIDYAEDMEDPTQTVYPYVPIDIVETLVEKHGGIKGPDEEQADRMKEKYVSTVLTTAYVTW